MSDAIDLSYLLGQRELKIFRLEKMVSDLGAEVMRLTKENEALKKEKDNGGQHTDGEGRPE